MIHIQSWETFFRGKVMHPMLHEIRRQNLRRFVQNDYKTNGVAYGKDVLGIACLFVSFRQHIIYALGETFKKFPFNGSPIR